MKEFVSVRAEELTPQLLQQTMAEHGYVLVRGVLPREAVRGVLRDVTALLAEARWLAEGADPLEHVAADGAGFGDPDPVFKQVYQQVFNLESFHALPHHASLRRVMEMLVGEQVLVHPKPIGRLIFPDCERLVVHAHQDYEFMRGDAEFYTTWIPLHDCPLEIGPLQVMDGSHRQGIVEHARENLHVPEISDTDSIAGEWTQGRINAGDVLIFHSLTVHAALPNRSRQMRLSMDCRFQDARRVLNPANLVFAGESGKSWEKTYAAWKSDALQYYWKKLSLVFEPTRDELERMAETAEAPAMRARYQRMVSQL